MVKIGDVYEDGEIVAIFSPDYYKEFYLPPHVRHGCINSYRAMTGNSNVMSEPFVLVKFKEPRLTRSKKDIYINYLNLTEEEINEVYEMQEPVTFIYYPYCYIESKINETV